ncbi:Alpha/Beta hydrolase protein [Aspergillus karnatakaensis]|uniref:lipase family protein n=1 Tax=Aspergillus karnatakaensis TaxID=1810916 RepID=UPI003CCCFEEE
MRKSFAQKLANSFTRSKTSRTTAEASTESSASIADTSQSTHSAATSRNLRDVSIRLDDYLDQIGLTGDEIDLDVISMSRQIEKARKYTNGYFPASVQSCSLSDEDVELVKLAAWSAKAVYSSDTSQMERVSRVEEFSDYQPTQHSENIDASLRDGTVKETRIQLFSSTKGSTTGLLVVAIRGSTSKRRDWTINFDDIGAGTDGDGFINTDDTKYQVHGGFLDCAKGMVEKISEAISSVLSKAEQNVSNKSFQLLFTGHSAGGAVAALLYAHMMSKNSSSLADLHPKFSSIQCITFGAPPTSNPALSTAHHPSSSTFLSIINEGDPVPRMDKEYIEALLIIYISPMPDDGVTWDLPAMLLQPAGTILFLKDGVQGFCDVKDDVGQKNTKDVLEATIFGNPRAHKMDMYLWKLGLVKGLF